MGVASSLITEAEETNAPDEITMVYLRPRLARYDVKDLTFIVNYHMRKYRLPFRIMFLAAVLLAGVEFVRRYWILGLFLPYLVEGPSMAPRWKGSHYRVICSDCGIEFAVDANQPPVSAAAICFNCGSLTELDPNSLRPGDSVRLCPARISKAQRWDVVAANVPDSGRKQIIKRIIGLPGEQVRLADGQVWIDGQLVQKSLEEFRRMAILVSDSNFIPTQQPSRWVRSTWDPNRIDLLTYRHSQDFSGPYANQLGVAIHDHNVYSQGTSRMLHPVNERLVEVILEAKSISQMDELGVALLDQTPTAVLQWNKKASKLSLLVNGELVHELPWKWKHPQNQSASVKIEFGVFDQRAILAIDQEVILQIDVSRQIGADISNSVSREKLNLRRGEIEIAASGAMPLEIVQVRIWRDLVWRMVVGKNASRYKLEPDEFFLVGDNGLESNDSRSFGPVNRDQLIGTIWGE